MEGVHSFPFPSAYTLGSAEQLLRTAENMSES
jgi:hypothetical protein